MQQPSKIKSCVSLCRKLEQCLIRENIILRGEELLMEYENCHIPDNHFEKSQCKCQVKHIKNMSTTFFSNFQVLLNVLNTLRP